MKVLASPTCLSIYGVELELFKPLSEYCEQVWYCVKYLSYDTSVRQHVIDALAPYIS